MKLQKLVEQIKGNNNESTLSAIIKTKNAGYVPPNVTIRQVIGENIFTVDLLSGHFQALKDDPNLEWAQISQKIPLQKELK